jgi:hypothetical protein
MADSLLAGAIRHYHTLAVFLFLSVGPLDAGEAWVKKNRFTEADQF